GKLEAALAALTYVNSKAGDAMGNLKAKLDKQAWELETAFEETKKRDSAIKALEERLDRLSILWWTIFSLSSDGPGAMGTETAQDGEDSHGTAGPGDFALASPNAESWPRDLLSGPYGGPPSLGQAFAPQNGPPPGQAKVASQALDEGDDSLGSLVLESQPAIEDFDPDSLDDSQDPAGISPAEEPEGTSQAEGPAQAEAPVAAASGDLGQARQNGSQEPSPQPPQGADGPTGETEGQDQGEKEKKESLGGSFLSELRKAARRAIFTRFLAGLAVAPSKVATANAPIELGSPETPMVIEALEPMRGPNVACLSSNYLGRNMDLGVVPSQDLALGAVKAEETARLMVSSQARSWGLSDEGYLRLVRLSHDREAKVDLRELEGNEAAYRLLKPFLPTVAKAMASAGLQEELAPTLMAAALDFSSLEGPFWERFFAQLRKKLKDDTEACLALKWHLALRQRRLERIETYGHGSLSRGAKNPTSPGNKKFSLEFAGEKAPLASLEAMVPNEAVALLASFVSNTWGQAFYPPKKKGVITMPLPKGNEPSRLAADLLCVASLNRVPRTLLADMLNADFNASGYWPSTIELYGWGPRLSDLLYSRSLAWNPAKPRLLDFDLLYDYLTSITRSSSLIKCHLRLRDFLGEALGLAPNLLIPALHFLEA
ncbi:MAG: hypothetical protein LBU69_02175, partial [Deltaproteobacteria bacterium]|nr:hypothetical protein [Deltaproteobacteria bacterium]